MKRSNINYLDKDGLAWGNVGARNELKATVWLLENGYHVLRNVSQHGPVDIVAIKDGIVTLFDVKARTIGFEDTKIRLTPQQIEMGVKGLAVLASGECIIDHSPLGPLQGEMVECPRCGKMFERRISSKVYCKKQCRPSFVVAASSGDIKCV